MSTNFSCLPMSLTVKNCLRAVILLTILCPVVAVSGVNSQSTYSQEAVYDALPVHIQFVGSDYISEKGSDLPIAVRAQAIVLRETGEKELSEVFSGPSILFAPDYFSAKNFPVGSSNLAELKERVEQVVSAWSNSFGKVFVMTLPVSNEISKSNRNFLNSKKGRAFRNLVDGADFELNEVNAINEALRALQGSTQNVKVFEFDDFISVVKQSGVPAKQLLTKNKFLSNLGQSVLVNFMVIPGLIDAYGLEINLLTIYDTDNEELIAQEKINLAAGIISWRSRLNGYYSLEWDQEQASHQALIPGNKALSFGKKSPLTEESILDVGSSVEAMSGLIEFNQSFWKKDNQYGNDFSIEIIGERLVLHLSGPRGKESIELEFNHQSNSYIGWSSASLSSESLTGSRGIWPNFLSFSNNKDSKIYVFNNRFEVQINAKSNPQFELEWTLLPRGVSHGRSQIGPDFSREQGSSKISASWLRHFEVNYKRYPQIKYELKANIKNTEKY